ncbi:MAG: DMT family transporter [bacterium]
MTKAFPAIFVVLWATGFIGARLGMPHAEPLSFLSLRYALAIALLGCIVLAARAPSGGRLVLRSKLALHSMVVGALLHGVYLGTVFWAIDRGMPAGVSAMIVGLQPLLTTAFAALLFGEPSAPRRWFYMALGLLGLVLVLSPKWSVSGSGIRADTIVACVLAVIAAALGTLYQKRYASDIDVRVGALWQYIGALAPTALAAAMLESFAFDWTPALWAALAWLVLALSISAVFLLMIMIRDGSVVRVSSLFYLVPAVTALIAWLMFDETLVPTQGVGMALCAAAVVLVMRTPTPTPASRPRA